MISIKAALEKAACSTSICNCNRAATKDRYRPLYAQCLADGADYRGALGQARLAQELRGVAGLAYPSTFAETSCITVLEAMAAGAFIFTTRLGALPETTNGFGYLVDAEPDAKSLPSNLPR